MTYPCRTLPLPFPWASQLSSSCTNYRGVQVNSSVIVFPVPLAPDLLRSVARLVPAPQPAATHGAPQWGQWTAASFYLFPYCECPVRFHFRSISGQSGRVFSSFPATLCWVMGARRIIECTSRQPGQPTTAIINRSSTVRNVQIICTLQFAHEGIISHTCITICQHTVFCIRRPGPCLTLSPGPQWAWSRV